MIAIGYAAVDDLTAWCLLAFMVSMAQSRAAGAILLELGVISETLFAMMVIMALVTTFATSPLLSAIQGAEALVGSHAVHWQCCNAEAPSTRPRALGGEHLQCPCSPRHDPQTVGRWESTARVGLGANMRALRAGGAVRGAVAPRRAHKGRSR